MAFSISPGVTVQEIDQTSVIPAVSTSVGAFAGVFKWGPANQAVLLASEDQLVRTFGKPFPAFNIETFFTAASFLAYSQSLYVSRALDGNTFNAVANTSAAANVQIGNLDDYLNETMPANCLYIAKYPGALGNSLQVSVCDSVNAYSSSTPAPANTNNSALFAFTPGSNTGTVTVTNSAGSNTIAGTDLATIVATISLGDYLLIGNTSTGTQYVQVTGISSAVAIANGVMQSTLNLGNTVYTSANVSTNNVTRYWQYFNRVSAAPGTSDYVASLGTGTGDELHVVIVDQDGAFSGVPGTVLEVYPAVSRATDAKDETGQTLYYKNVINGRSPYVWWTGDRAGAASATAASVIASTNQKPITLSFSGGTDSAAEGSISVGDIQNAYNVYKNADEIDISLVLTGKAVGGIGGELLPNYLIDNISEGRLDCVTFVSPAANTVINNFGAEATSIIAFGNNVSVSSYAVVDTGYKYMYDKYNDQYNYVPLNGDIAGLAARTDVIADPWYSPAGYNRGIIKNVVKLAYNPNKTDRDILYAASINPVVTFPGQGTLLYGDKTHLAKPSAFDRINVRRLFIVLEKAIAIAAKFMLFEFNDPITQARFRNMVNPYLRDIQGRRGITAFNVVCDSSNNPPQVVDANEFVGSMYVQPARSINFINLVFTAVATGVSFTETVGTVAS